MKKFITIYDRYIFTQVLVTTLVAILLFTIVWIAPEMLLNTIKKERPFAWSPSKSYELDSIEVISFWIILILSIIKMHSSSNETSLHINACANIPSVFFLIRSSLINASNITLRLVRLETVIWTTPLLILYKKKTFLSWIFCYFFQNFPKIFNTI